MSVQHSTDTVVMGNNLNPLEFQLLRGQTTVEIPELTPFNGPTFNCLSVALDADRILLQDADPVSLALAQRLGLQTSRDTITLFYDQGLVVVPRFQGDSPAYFGDHCARTCT